MTDRLYLLLRVAAILAVTSAVVLMINGSNVMTSEDDEMPFVILATIWATLYLTKRRRI